MIINVGLSINGNPMKKRLEWNNLRLKNIH